MATAPMTSPRPAATTVVLRDRDGGCEVLLLRRSPHSGFAANYWVFPGGTVDAADRTLPRHRYRGIDPDGLVERFAGNADTVLGFHVAAVRETFEEAGMLLASGDVADADLESARRGVSVRSADAAAFSAFLDRYDLVLELGRLAYLARWITPRISGRRYDTAFFVTGVPTCQVARHDEVETTAKQWVHPARALDAHRAGALRLMRPTAATLGWLADHRSAAAAVSAARAQPTVPWILPHVERRGDGSRLVLHPTDPGFPHDDYADELCGPIR